MGFENVKCATHQKYECKRCIPDEGPVAKARRLEADNERLRSLVKAAEWSDGYICHHCAGKTSNCHPKSENGRHTPDCPAFTPEGEVR